MYKLTLNDPYKVHHKPQQQPKEECQIFLVDDLR
jgi:hypothetical protein